MAELELVQLISQVGFPIAMCAYLLFRFEQKLDANTRMTQRLGDIIQARLPPSKS